jgi:hypothetical protein
MAITHKVHAADLVSIYRWKPNQSVGCLVYPLPPLPDEFLSRQKGPVELLVPPHTAHDLVNGDILEADVMLAPDLEFVTDPLKGEQVVRRMPRKKVQNATKEDSPSSLRKGLIRLMPHARIKRHRNDSSSISRVR